MHWLFLLMAIGALFGALRTASLGWMAFLLLLSLGLMVAWVLGWMSARLGSRNARAPMIDPAELQRLREQAEARRQQQDVVRREAGTP